jgi:hypothetical protein
MAKVQSKRIILAMTLGLSSIVLTFNACADGVDRSNFDYGLAITTDYADREINVTSATKWVNVQGGETVRFNVDGKKFTWHFDTFNDQSFDFSKIAPKDIHMPGIRVYVAGDPLFRG